MLGKFFIFIFTILIVSQHVFGADINASKNNALKKIEKSMSELRLLSNETIMALPNRQGNVGVIAKHVRDAGDGVYQNSNFLIHKVAIFAFMKTVLLNLQQDAAKCVEEKEKRNYQQTENDYTKGFMTNINKLETQAQDLQNKDIKLWTEEYNSAIFKINEVYQITAIEINKSKTEDEIVRILYDFDRHFRDVTETVTKINSVLNALHLRFLDMLEKNLKEHLFKMRNTIDVMSIMVKECYGDVLESKEIF